MILIGILMDQSSFILGMKEISKHLPKIQDLCGKLRQNLTLCWYLQNTGNFLIVPYFIFLSLFFVRYYGETLPYGNQSYSSPKHLGYLTSTQALADYVLLIDYLVHKHRDSDAYIKNPVVAFGGSYGGMLSAWLRMKYPASVIGAIAASAPIWQFNGLVPCNIYNKILTSVYAATEAGCDTAIRRSWTIIR